MNKTYSQRTLSIILMLTFCSFGLSSWLTGKGIYNYLIEANVANTEGIITATMSAIVAASLIGGSVMMLFGFAVRATKEQDAQLIKLALGLAPFIFGISTFFAIMGNSGAPSLVFDMRDRTVEASSYFKQVRASSSVIENARAGLLQVKNKVCRFAITEKKYGSITGSPKAGAVSAAYDGACTSLETVVDNLDETITTSGKSYSEASELIKKLAPIYRNTELTIFERQDQFREVVTELKEVLNRVNVFTISDRIITQVDILKSNAAVLDVRDNSFGSKQSNAISALENELEKVASIITKLVSSDASSAIREPQELMNMGEAVFHYWERNFNTMLLAIMLDFINLWFLLFLRVSCGYPPNNNNKNNQ